MKIKSIMFIETILTNLWIVFDCLKRQADHNDNEILSIIEKFHEAGFIINWNGIRSNVSQRRNIDQ